MENKVVDALSRVTEQQELNAIYSNLYWLDFTHVKIKIKSDPYLIKVIENLFQDPTSRSEFIWCGELLYYKGRMVLSRDSSLIPILL